MAQLLLHGTLLATIFEIDRLNGGCAFNFCGKAGGPERMTKRFLSHLKKMVLCRPEIVGSRLYSTIDLERARVGRTRMIENDPYNPRWYESFYIYCAHMASNVIFTVKNNDPVGATLIGRAYLPVREIIDGYEVDKWIDILDEDGTPIHGGSKIHVKIQFFHVTRDGTWSQGMNIPGFVGVPRTFFKQRQGCKVVLYQDAHVPYDEISEDLRAIGYESHRCWEDIFDAITNAKHMIYITGWAVYTNITLIRDTKRPKPGGNLTLGELLINKAKEGLKVLLLVWDDRTSVEAYKKDGLMATHDTETEEYFRGTKVNCVLCPRIPGGGDSFVQGFQISTMFTHHQKTIIVDAEISGENTSNKRRIVSFLGGIDLCDGRYDTRDHPLFRTLNNVHNKDFHQPNFPGSSIQKGGPREPWHDTHCKLEGPAAWDVLYNFEQRWKKQARAKDLFALNELRAFTISPSPVTSGEDPDTWDVQVFRSIDHGAVLGFPKNPNEAAKAGLITGKDNVMERSIQDGYINAIRRAKNFIYIENQYFLGSSYGWEQAKDISVNDINALHLIPKELSLKIISKIEAGERFMVYIVIPMWPEGIPETASVQAILDWQRRTMEMMYKDIAQALKAKGLVVEDLREYLTFFCLGNREFKKDGEYVPSEKPDPDTNYSRAQQARRFMIYVHSKMMIVDDEYIILGSANINERSMNGGRDTEIAIGAYQPNQLAASGNLKPDRSKIFGFRAALWQEHLGILEEEFQKPESLSCVRLVNQIADNNLDIYTSDTLTEDLLVHLLRYPVNVSGDGVISTLPGFEFFPDTKARVLGTKSDYFPPILTT